MLNKRQATIFGLVALVIGLVVLGINFYLSFNGNSIASLWILAIFFFISSTFFFVATSRQSTNH